MAGEFEGIQVRGEGDETLGATMINVAMALMREVKSEVARMNEKLDKIGDERRDEAREHGGLEVRVANLETSHRMTKGVAYTVAGVVTVGLLIFLLRLAVLHPEALPK